jgi:FixJ family two-component response regulator/DNA-binding MarR family transcriptional regulator
MRRDFKQSPDRRCKILIVDDDLDFLVEVSELVASLGHAIKCAESVKSALSIIEEDDSIAVVITDLRMDGLGGIDLLAEIDARFAARLPIQKILLSGFADYDCAVEAMRYGAIDVVTKPMEAFALMKALRRALLAWNGALIRASSPVPSLAEESADQLLSTTDSELLKCAKLLQRQRAKRAEILKREFFSDPAWDIFLDLGSAKLTNQKVSVSSACAAAQVPFSTALRYVGRLVEDGLAERFGDPTDKRRDILQISERGLVHFRQYLSSISATLRSQ